MSEKELKALQDEEINKISGGSNGDTKACRRCDICKDNVVYGGILPIGKDKDICIDCIKRYRELLGDKAFEKWIEMQAK